MIGVKKMRKTSPVKMINGYNRLTLKKMTTDKQNIHSDCLYGLNVCYLYRTAMIKSYNRLISDDISSFEVRPILQNFLWNKSAYRKFVLLEKRLSNRFQTTLNLP